MIKCAGMVNRKIYSTLSDRLSKGWSEMLKSRNTFDPLSYKNEENDMAVTITKKTVLLMSLPQRRGKGR